MAFPRGAALAEVAWSPAAAKSWDSFVQRMPAHEKRLAAAGIGHRPFRAVEEVAVGGWNPKQMSTEFKTLTWDLSVAVKEGGAYEAEFIYARGKCGVAIRSASVLQNGVEIAKDVHDAFAGANSRKNIFTFNLPKPAPGAKLTLQASLRSDGGTDSSGQVFVHPAGK
jgi:hypothetical protein